VCHSKKGSIERSLGSVLSAPGFPNTNWLTLPLTDDVVS